MTLNLTDSLNSGEQKAFKIKAKIKTTAPSTGTFVNNVSIAGTAQAANGDLGESVTAQSSSNVSPIDVWVQKTVSKPNVLRGVTTPARAGEIFSYTISYGNYSNQNLSNITIVDTIPAQYSYVNDASCGGCSYNSGTNQLTWTGLTLGDTETKNMSFNVQVKNDVALATNVCNLVNLTAGTITSNYSACNNIVDYKLKITKTASQNEFRIDPLRPESTFYTCLLYTSPSPRDGLLSRMPSSA